MLAAALVVILDLGTRPFQISVVVKELQSPGYLLRAAAKQGDDLMRAKKAMPVNEPDDVTVAFGKSHGNDRGSAFEAGKAGRHRATLWEMQGSKKTSQFAFWDNFFVLATDVSRWPDSWIITPLRQRLYEPLTCAQAFTGPPP
jgi:hypothetical protein